MEIFFSVFSATSTNVYCKLKIMKTLKCHWFLSLKLEKWKLNQKFKKLVKSIEKILKNVEVAYFEEKSLNWKFHRSVCLSCWKRREKNFHTVIS